MDRNRAQRRRRPRISSVLPYLVLVALVLLIIPPIAWLMSTAFKPPNEAVGYPPVWIPEEISVQNFIDVAGSSAPRFFLNSFIAGLGAVAVALLVGIPAAYGATRLRFRGKEMLLGSILVISTIPGIVVLVALYGMLIGSPLINTFPLLIVVYTGMIAGQSIWLVRGFIENVPIEIEDAALVDGCDRKRVIYHVVLPLIRPGIASVAIFVFIFVWNDFLVGSILTTTEEMRTVQVGLVRYLETGFGAFWGSFAAYALLAFTPVLILFVGFQRWFIAGLTAGGVKG